jgi:hypothetical protein
MKQQIKKMSPIGLLLLSLQCAVALDNHFYRSSYFWGEPRFEKPWLGSLDISVGGAQTRTGRNGNGDKTSLFNILGPHNMQKLGTTVPGINSVNPLDQILINLENLPKRKGFGQLVFSGKFSIVETHFNAYQNLINGFFVQAYLPLRRLLIRDIQYKDLSPDDAIFPNKNTPEWQKFLVHFDAILKRWNLSLKGADQFSIGDLRILGGWAQNYEDTHDFDFFDVDVKIGILFPTGQKKNPNQSFDLSLGYNGFFGAPLSFNCSIGALDWFTTGLHLEALFFFDKTQELRVKTDTEQNGFIKLARAHVEVEQGTIWQVGWYTKADHFFKGLSLLFSYAYTRKDSDCIEPKNKEIYNPIIINTDRQFKSWNMHVLNFLIEYDLAQKSTDIGPRIGLVYNRIIGGQRIFDAHIAATYIGVDFAWCF